MHAIRQLPGWFLPLLAGMVARLTVLGGRPLWLDELISWNAALALTPEVFLADLHPPTYALLVALLSPLGAVHALRVPSVVAGMLTVWVAWSAAQVWGGPRAANVAAWAVAVSSPWVGYSIEGRPYAIAGLVIWLLLWHLGRQSHPVRALLVGLFSALWTWTGVALAACLIVVVALDPRRRSQARWIGLGWCLAALPLIVGVLIPQLSALDGSPAAQSPAWTATWPLLDFLGWMVSGPMSFGREAVGAVVGVVLLRSLAQHRQTPVGAMLWLSGLLFLGAHMVGLHPLGATRQCLVLTAPVILMLAVAVQQHGAQWSGNAVLSVTIVAVLLTRWSRPGVPVVDVPSMIRTLPETARPLWIDPRIAPAWTFYAGPEFATGTWAQPDPSSGFAGWVVSPASGEPHQDSHCIRVKGVASWRSGGAAERCL